MKTLRDAVIHFNYEWPDDRAMEIYWDKLNDTSIAVLNYRPNLHRYQFLGTRQDFEAEARRMKQEQQCICGDALHYRCPIHGQDAPGQRGPEDGLPPEGTDCEVYFGLKWRPCTIVAHVNANGTKQAIYQGESDWDFETDPERFRPIQPDRERVIDDTLKSLPKQEMDTVDHQLHAERIVQALYEANRIKLPEGEEEQ